MDEIRPRTTLSHARVAALIALTSWSAAAAPPPAPTPTATAGRRTLAQYAAARRLRGDTARGPTGTVEVSNESLLRLAGDADLTVAAPAATPDRRVPAPHPPDSAGRQHWRRRYAGQRTVIRRLEERRAGVDERLAELRRGRVDARALAREDRLRSQREQIDRELRRAREELATIVREARREGAQPGWFHGL